MSEEYAREMFEKALGAMSNEQLYLALNCFEQAREMEKDPLYLSSRALCVAKARRSFKEAVYLCREALDKEPANPVHYLNMGKIYLVAGQKKRALKSFQEGLKHSENNEIIEEIGKLGFRKAPLFKFLDRKHPLNKYSGILLSMIGIR
jgi:tetratricopeptide (TPR) repeat protein